MNAFEKSLASMTNRLQTLTATTEKKVCDFNEKRVKLIIVFEKHAGCDF